VSKLCLVMPGQAVQMVLAADVILAEADSPAVTDALEAELTIFRDRIERALLMPDQPKPGALPG
jgi:hypothetical protein